MHDVLVIGGGFAGVTSARETALRGANTVLLAEATALRLLDRRS